MWSLSFSTTTAKRCLYLPVAVTVADVSRTFFGIFGGGAVVKDEVCRSKIYIPVGALQVSQCLDARAVFKNAAEGVHLLCYCCCFLLLFLLTRSRMLLLLLGWQRF